MNRREALRDVLVSATLGAVSAVGITAVVWGPRLRTPEIEEAPNPSGDPRWVATEPVVIKKGVNIRTYPAIPTPPLLRIPRERAWHKVNAIRWEDIEEVNSVPLNGANMFVVYNAPIVEGEDTYKRRRFRNEKQYGRWTRVSIKIKGQQQTRLHFINISSQTEEFVRPVNLAYYLDASDYQKTPDGDFVIEGHIIAKNEIGKVVVPEDIDQIPGLWQLRVAAKLVGLVPLNRFDEKRYEEVLVVPAGFSWTEIIRMKELDLPVKVVEFPSTTYPNGEPVRVVGNIKLGTKITNVLLTEYEWGVFRRGDVAGEVLDREDNPVNIDPNKILVVDSAFLLSTSSPILTGRQD